MSGECMLRLLDSKDEDKLKKGILFFPKGMVTFRKIAKYCSWLTIVTSNAGIGDFPWYIVFN